jgi:hypothetical protein
MAIDPEVQRSNTTDDELVAMFNRSDAEVVKRGPGRPPKDKIAEINSALADVWIRATCAAIVSKQVLSASDVPKATAIADAVVDLYKTKFVG